MAPFYHFFSPCVNEVASRVFACCLLYSSKHRPRRPVIITSGDCMRILLGAWLALAVTVFAAQSGKSKHAEPGPKQGIKTPGVQIPFSSLKADVELPFAPQWMVFSDSVLIPNKAGGLERLDAKTNKLVGPIADITRTCGGAAVGFPSLWIPNCAAH